MQEFQQSPSSEEALVILAQSYDRLGLTQLRDDTQRVLKTNFPNAAAGPTGIADRKAPWWKLW